MYTEQIQSISVKRDWAQYSSCPCGQSDVVFLLSYGSIRIWNIFRLNFRSSCDVLHSDVSGEKTAFSMLKECFRFFVQ